MNKIIFQIDKLNKKLRVFLILIVIVISVIGVNIGIKNGKILINEKVSFHKLDKSYTVPFYVKKDGNSILSIDSNTEKGSIKVKVLNEKKEVIYDASENVKESIIIPVNEGYWSYSIEYNEAENGYCKIKAEYE